METTTCRNCGGEVKGKFCTNCGTPIPEESGSSADESGATTVIRAEDLRAMQERELAGGGPGGAFSQEQTGAQPNNPADTGPAWGQAASSNQQGGFQEVPTGGGYTQPPPNQSYNQTYSAPPPPQGNPQSFYGGGTGGTTMTGSYTAMGVGDLISGALNVLTSRMPDVIPLVIVYAIIYTIGQFLGKGGVGLSLIGALVGLVGYAVIEAGMVLITNSTTSGETASFGDLMPRIMAVLPRLIPAVILAAIAIAIGLVIIIIPGIVLFTFLLFVPQSVTLDGASVFGSFGESWNLVAKDFFGILGRVIVAILILIVAAIVAAILGAILSKIPIVGSLVAGLIDGVLLAYFMAYATLMFLGMKSRVGSAVGAGAGSSF